MYEAFLLARLDRSRACGSHARDRLVRRRTKFDQKPRRNQAGAAEPAAAVDQHVSPAAQKRPQFCARSWCRAKLAIPLGRPHQMTRFNC
jgi:hypothetical protein